MVSKYEVGLFLIASVFLVAACTPNHVPTAELVSTNVACEELALFEAPGLVVETAKKLLEPGPQPNPYGGEPMPPLSPHCLVAGVIDDEINFELRLPFPENWNGRFAMGGGGGFVGTVDNYLLHPAPGSTPVLDAGYATVGTDTGHQGAGIDASWALDNDTRERNFAHRAVHVVAVASKQLVEHYYGKPSEKSYFVGCSRGGGQGMIASQRYPDDFDGIVAGAPGFAWPGFGAAMVQNQQALYPDPTALDEPIVTPENRALLEREIRAACDSIDGVADGILTDPRACPFDPADLPRCNDGPAAECITDAQLAAIQRIYNGPELAGESLFPGFPFGGENDLGGWDFWITGGAGGAFGAIPNLHYAFGTEIYKYLVYDNPDFDYSSYDFANWHADTAAADELLSAKDPDLSAFRDRGGKIVFWHGWSDPALSALATIDYFEALRGDTEDTDAFARLYLLPGVLHCGGGPGAGDVDWLALVADWVENSKAPNLIEAPKIGEDGTAIRTSALCPYPETASYDGTGDPKAASSYKCARTLN